MTTFFMVVPSICGSSVWNLLDVTCLVPRIRGGFWILGAVVHQKDHVMEGKNSISHVYFTFKLLIEHTIHEVPKLYLSYVGILVKSFLLLFLFYE